MRRFRTFAALIALITVVGLIAETDARPRKKAAGWTKLGERVVSDRIDRDTIRVTAQRGSFTKLRFKVERRAVQFRDMKVHYANGDVQDVPLRDVVKAGERSRVIDLPGGNRVITKVTFVYDAQAFGGRTATVKLYGRR